MSFVVVEIKSGRPQVLAVTAHHDTVAAFPSRDRADTYLSRHLGPGSSERFRVDESELPANVFTAEERVAALEAQHDAARRIESVARAVIAARDAKIQAATDREAWYAASLALDLALDALAAALPKETVTVCSECLRACCWQGEFMCDKARLAGTVEKTKVELMALGREHPSYWEPRS